MKQAAIVVIFISLLVGGAAWYGFTRHSGGASASAETAEKVALAERFMETNQPKKALEALDALTAANVKFGEKEDLIKLRALEATGAHDQAAEAAEKFLKNYPASEDKETAELTRLTAGLAGSGVSNPALRKSVEDFLAANPTHPGAGKLQIALARQEIAVGDYRAAQRRLEGVMDSAQDEGELLALAQPLGKANMERLLSKDLGDGDQFYTVASGDAIYNIAKKFGASQELILKCNGIDDPRKLRVGQKLKIPSVDFSLVVDITQNTMTLKNHGEFFKMYSVRTGREQGSTPRGDFTIQNKKKGPTWKPGNGNVYGPGDPNNELGTRWMSFQADIYGIHGTIHPETVGEYASNGCVGMTTPDVEELFDLITEGTPLHIQGEWDFERHNMIPAGNVPPPREVASK